MNNTIEMINITPFNPLISKCQIKVCWVGYQPNRNHSIITKEVATEMANSLPGSPIVGFYNEEIGDFEQHNKILEIKDGKLSLKPTTRPYGFVDLNAKVWFQWFIDNDGVAREYLMTEGWLWTGQYPECQRVIDKGNNHSMEISDDEKYLDAHWTKDENGNKEFFIINEAIFSKLCILGEKFTPCFEGSSITAPKIEFALEDSFKQELFSMIEEIKNILDEGGAKMEGNTTNIEQVTTDDVKVEEPVVEEGTPEPEVNDPEPAANTEPNGEEGNNDGEGEGADAETAYNLEEIAEYVELKNKYEELQNNYNNIVSDCDALKTKNEALTAFKADVDKKEKENMIKNFYMLSDEDKKDVVENIDKYSLDEIEAKLSILCVRNKVNFNLEEDNKNNDPISYSLNETQLNANVPEWIKAVQENVAEN